MDNNLSLLPNDKKPKKRASKKQIKANRKNGKLGGPKTEAGKMQVSRNAIRHGLLAQEVVIEVGDGIENKHDFDLLFGEYIEHYAPQGPIENALVELMAVGYWRYRRLIKAEKGEIRKHLDSVHLQVRTDQIREHDLSKIMPLHGRTIPELVDNVLELSDILKLIQDATEDLETLCYVTDRTLARLTKYLGQELDSVSTLAFVHNTGFKERATEFVDNNKDPHKIPEIKLTVGLLLKKLRQDKERVMTQIKNIEKRQELNISSQALCLNVPPKEIMDKFIRYESSILKQFFKAMHELERIQRRRKGEFVPLPINVDIAVEKN